MSKGIVFRPGRRSFLLNTGSVAALSMFPAALTRAATIDYSNLLLFADFEQATWADALQAQSPYVCSWRDQSTSGGTTLSTRYQRHGSTAFRSYLQNGGGARRAEIVGFNDAAFDRQSHRWGGINANNASGWLGVEHWYGFSVFIPPDFDNRSTCWELIHQLHGEPPSSYVNYWNRNPWFAIYVGSQASYPGHYGLVIRYCPVWMAESSKADVRTGYRNESISFLPDIGKWTDWVVQCRPDYRPNNQGGVGLTRVWKDGQLIVDYQGPNYDNQDRGPYVKFGLYKGDWANGRSDDPVRDRSYFYDEIRVSRANVGAYDLVAPRGDAGGVPPKPPSVEVG